MYEAKDIQGVKKNKRYMNMKNEFKQDLKGQHFNKRLHAEATRKGSGTNTLSQTDLNNPTTY